MIENKKDYLYYLEADRIALGEKRKHPHIISIWESDVIWKYQRTLRKVEYLHNCKSSGFHKIYYKWVQYRLFRAQVKTGIGIPINVFGPGMSIAHLGPIVINGFAKVAIVGDNVYLSNGCKLIGDIEIGDGIVIAAGAVVTKSFTEENAVVGGVPAKVISYSGNPFPLERRGADIAKR